MSSIWAVCCQWTQQHYIFFWKKNLKMSFEPWEAGFGSKYAYYATLPPSWTFLYHVFSAGPWTVFAPTNEAFMNLPMTYLENMIQNPERLSKLVLNHLVNKTIFKAGLKSHQEVRMANGNTLNLYARPGKDSVPVTPIKYHVWNCKREP